MSEPIIIDTLKRIQTDPAGGQVSAFWEKTTTINDQSFVQPWTQNTWPLGGTEDVNIILKDGTTAVTTREKVFTAVVSIATQEHNK